MIEDWRAGGFGLYIHWPFCEAKCPYCDFNSHVSARIDQSRWLDAYIKEIERYAIELPDRVVNSIFFGGGTPSLMHPSVVHGVLDKVRQSWPMANDLEVTLEANPSSVEASRFKGYADAGVNRVSIGIQALNDIDLKKLGRLHSVSEARAALEVARETFDRVSFDLIYARQNQSLDEWTDELDVALKLAVDHLSLYQLTIEEGTAFGDRYASGGLRGLPTDDLAADMYEATQEMCKNAGLLAYEVSNHAKPGSESRHNLVYWRYGDYVGIGPGAHGRITKDNQKSATETWLNPERWLTAALSGSGEKERSLLSPKEQATEFLLLGLRISEGISLDRYARISGEPLNDASLERLKGLGMIRIKGDQVFVTEKGRPVLNSVITELL